MATSVDEQLDKLRNTFGADSLEITMGEELIFVETGGPELFRIEAFSGVMMETTVHWTKVD